MSATVTTTLSMIVEGLGNEDSLTLQFSPPAPTASTHLYKKLTTADVDEVLALGSVTTPTGIWITAKDYAIDIDANYSSSFSADITVGVGQAAYFMPKGVVRVKNTTSSQQPTFEYCVVG